MRQSLSVAEVLTLIQDACALQYARTPLVAYAEIPRGMCTYRRGTCQLCCHRELPLIHDHCHAHGWLRGHICLSCNTTVWLRGEGRQPKLADPIEPMPELLRWRLRCLPCGRAAFNLPPLSAGQLEALTGSSPPDCIGEQDT
jgi:Recombination endonuclease VII